MKTKLHPNNEGAGSALSEADSRRQIEKRAYELWLADGRPNGQEMRHWLQAEKEVQQGRRETPKRGPSARA